MTDPTRVIADILYGPEFSNRDLPTRTPTPTAPVLPVFHTQTPAHDDDIQAAGDELRDQDDYRPTPEELC